MTEYVRISTPSRSATTRASPTGRTLKPSTTASDAAARLMSDSVMPPTPERTTCTCTSDCGSLAISSSNASSEPETSALRTRLRSWISPPRAWSKMVSSDTFLPDRRACASLLRRKPRSFASWRARRSFSTTRTYSPASGTVSKPSTSTGSDGVAVLTLRPLKSCSARTRPQCAPATSASPTLSVPRLTSTVTTAPRPGSSFDSITTPDASTFGFALSSSTSASSRIDSSRSSRFVLAFAETSTNIVSPPHSSGWRPSVVISVRTRSGCAPSLSILLTATRIGTSAALAWSTASRVCGITPSSAATTITAMSVTWPPRLELLVGVLELGLRVDLVGRVDDLDLLVELVGDHLHGVVGQRLRERRHLAQLHQLLDDLRHGDAEVLGDVLDGRAGVDLDDVGLQDRDVLRHGLLVGAAPAPAAAPRRAPLRSAAGTAAGPTGATGAAGAARGLRVDHHAADAAGRAGRALALQRGARRPARSALAVALRLARRLLRLRRELLGRARAEIADTEIPGRAQLRALRLLRLGAVRARLLLPRER